MRALKYAMPPPFCSKMQGTVSLGLTRAQSRCPGVPLPPHQKPHAVKFLCQLQVITRPGPLWFWKGQTSVDWKWITQGSGPAVSIRRIHAGPHQGWQHSDSIRSARSGTAPAIAQPFQTKGINASIIIHRQATSYGKDWNRLDFSYSLLPITPVGSHRSYRSGNSKESKLDFEVGGKPLLHSMSALSTLMLEVFDTELLAMALGTSTRPTLPYVFSNDLVTARAPRVAPFCQRAPLRNDTRHVVVLDGSPGLATAFAPYH
ncbi:hypothetical protein EDB83DRAFT_469052 [Lactarius deliciosus]|nr:hypothetical protein EDB83DRAFT_469052 [Lactarius deliciosus]